MVASARRDDKLAFEQVVTYHANSFALDNMRDLAIIINLIFGAL